MRWGKNRAYASLHFVPPSKPSYSELCIYTKYLRKVQKKLDKRVELLILGSTAEFRDWGFEQLLNVTLIDYSRVYHKEAGKGRRHRNRKEKFIHKRWQDMDFKNKYDIILGDMVILNLEKNEIDGFIKNIYRALNKNGIFMTKSVFKSNKKINSLDSMFQNYSKNHSHVHPITKLYYDLFISCLQDDKDTINLKSLFEKIKDLYNRRVIVKDIYDIFYKIRWYDSNFDMHVPTLETWENIILKNFKKYKKEYSEDVYSPDIPVYIMFKK